MKNWKWKKKLEDCNRYLTSIENIENEKPYTGSENPYFKTIATSKIVFQSLTTNVPKHIVNKLDKIQNAFLSKNSTSKIKHETLCNDSKAGELVILTFQTTSQFFNVPG